MVLTMRVELGLVYVLHSNINQQSVFLRIVYTGDPGHRFGKVVVLPTTSVHVLHTTTDDHHSRLSARRSHAGSGLCSFIIHPDIASQIYKFLRFKFLGLLSIGRERIKSEN